jgi:hypothetical protein
MTDRSHHHDWRQNWDKPALKAPDLVKTPEPEPVVIPEFGAEVVPESPPVVEVHEEPEAPAAEAETHE